MEVNITRLILEACNASVICDDADRNSSVFIVPEGNSTKRRRLKASVPAFTTAALILSWINALLIIALNVAVIVIILRYKKRSRLYFLLLNLAIADAFPTSIERSVGFKDYTMYWFSGEFGDVSCKLQRFLSSVSMTASNYILAVTSFDRALVVAKPLLSFRRGHVLQKCMIISCWLFSCAASSPMIGIMEVTPHRKGFLCRPNFVGDKQLVLFKFRVYFLTLCLIVVVIPLVIIIVSFTVLLVAIYRRALSPQNSLQGKTHLSLAQVFNRGVPRTKARSMKLMIGIILSFIISWSIYFIFIILNVFKVYNDIWMMIFMTFYFWNCIANPILFFIFHRRQSLSSQTSLNSSERRTEFTQFNLSLRNSANCSPLIIHSGEKSSAPSKEGEIKPPIMSNRTS